MINNKKVVVVMPAYNAAKTLEKTYREIPFDIVDDVVLVDDASTDKTVAISKKLGIKHLTAHDTNKGYGGNQKTCYDKALELGADIVVMLHPDYQYTPKLVKPLVDLVSSGLYPVAVGSRMLGKGARRGGMPAYKYFSNRFLTFIQNIIFNQNLAEYHTGYRAYSREVLETVNYRVNSDNYIFDNEMLSQIFMAGFDVAEVSCPANYFKEASSPNLLSSTRYGIGVLRVTINYFLHKIGFNKSVLYKKPLN